MTTTTRRLTKAEQERKDLRALVKSLDIVSGCRPSHHLDLPVDTIIRGCCPDCSAPLVTNLYRTESDGSIILVSECWHAMMPVPTCTYRHVL